MTLKGEGFSKDSNSYTRHIIDLVPCGSAIHTTSYFSFVLFTWTKVTSLPHCTCTHTHERAHIHCTVFETPEERNRRISPFLPYQGSFESFDWPEWEVAQGLFSSLIGSDLLTVNHICYTWLGLGPGARGPGPGLWGTAEEEKERMSGYQFSITIL